MKRHSRPQKKCQGLQIRARSGRHDVAGPSIRPQESQDHLVKRHTVIAAAVVISLALLGWYVLVGYVVTITGSTAGLPDIGTATAHLVSALLGANTL